MFAVKRLSVKFGPAILIALLSLFCGQAIAAEQSAWQELSNDTYPPKILKVLAVYGIKPSYLASKRFQGLSSIEGALLFRASDHSTCDSSSSGCWYILLPNEHAEPIVTSCDFREGSLPHHFNPDKSNFFVFDFTCSGARMQIQVSNGQSLIAVGK